MEQLVTLSPAILPVDFPVRRDIPPRSSVLTETFWAEYDQDTLFYDAMIDETGLVTLHAPKLFNLRPVLLSALSEACPGAKVRVWTGRRNDLVRFRLPKGLQELGLRIGTTDLAVPLNPVDRDQFRGLDALYTMSWDNDLGWIKDWMIWHNRAHGVNAAIIAMAPGKAYDEAELLAAMASVPGYRALAVVPVPFPYGPGLQTANRASDGAFLQVAMLNAMRDRFLSRARTVLNLDIDELVVGRDGQSICDATARSLFGVTLFDGHWRYAGLACSGVRHADHVYRKPGDRPCPPKYCFRPRSFLGRGNLRVHDLSLISRRLVFKSRRFHFLHMKQITTSWKEDRSPSSLDELAFDAETARACETFLARPVQSAQESP